jgi:hypothetical protein
MFKPGDKVIVARSTRNAPPHPDGRIEGRLSLYYVGDVGVITQVNTFDATIVACKIKGKLYNVKVEELEYDTKLAKYLAGAHE